MQAIPIWPVTMFYFVWAEHNTHADTLKSVCQVLEQHNQVSNVATSIKHNLYESAFNFVETPNASVEAWSHWAKDCIFKSAARVNSGLWPAGASIDVELHESWCHITRDGGYHDSHVHPGSSWSCIYYLDPGDTDIESKNGVNRFYNPNNSMYVDAGTQYMSQSNSIDVSPQSGMLIVFPSWIPHSALCYRGQSDRYVLSANSQITVS
jgi:uncharacterized protein (TIGR02466 family)